MKKLEMYEIPIHVATNFFEVSLQDNTLDVVCEESHLLNIYSYLYQEGFRMLCINEQRELYRKSEGEITIQSVGSMMKYFFQKLQSLELYDKALLVDVWDYFDEKECIQKDLLMEYALTPKADADEDKHKFLLRYNKKYRCTYQNKRMNELFDKHEFEELELDLGQQEDKLPVYYKTIEEGKYLVFTKYRSEHSCIGMAGFDCWISSQKPVKKSRLDPREQDYFKKMKEDFDPLEDWPLIQAYLNN